MAESKKPQIFWIIISLIITFLINFPAYTQSEDGRPIANAGTSRYAATDPVHLDGTGSYYPDKSNTLNYSWRQISGPTVIISDTNTATSTVSGFVQTEEIQECEFELVVSDGELTSLPDTVKVIIVPDFGNSRLRLANDSFDPNKPTLTFFGGGDCVTGSSGQYVSDDTWNSIANIINFPNGYEPDAGTSPRTFYRNADMIIVYLSSVAPDYKQPIQITGASAGAQPAIDVGIHLNKTYKDARYAVNRVSFFDAAPGCRDYSESVKAFLASSVDGEQCWLDNYVSSRADFYPNVLNVGYDKSKDQSIPEGDRHRLAAYWYLYSLADMNQFNHGVVAGAYWSVAGPGKNLQLASTPDTEIYTFRWYGWYGLASSGYMDFYNESLYPGRLPEPVTLVGPEDGSFVDANGAVFSCEESENAIGYQLLFGPDPYHVMDYYIISDTLNPPSEVIIASPFEQTWWTVKAYDQYGSTIYADPILVNFENLAPPLIENITIGKRYGSLRHAIDDARNGHEIVVSPGVYREKINFKGKNLTIRSTNPDDMTVVSETVITADGDVVTFSSGEDANCVLDGFTITGGKRGVYCSNSSPVITNCTITGNVNADMGAGMYIEDSSSPTLVNCTFSDNSASMGGGIQNMDSSPILINCSFSGNSGTYFGGAIYCASGSPVLTNCILWGDTPDEILILSGNPVITYSNIQGGFTGEGNIDADPLFADAANGDYHLKSDRGRLDPNSQSWIKDDVTSPCIDAGDPNSDFSGETWPHGGRINMGAYGGTREASMSIETGGLSLPNVAYIYFEQGQSTEDYKSLLNTYGCTTTLIPSNEVATAGFDAFDLIIVGADTGYLTTWTDEQNVAAVEGSGKPVLGLGNGGYWYFGQLELSIGRPFGGHSSENSIEVFDPNSPVFNTPYAIEIPEDRSLQLYTKTDSIGIYLWPTIPETVTGFGRHINEPGYYFLVAEHDKYMFWGFIESPQKMTDLGKTLFINVVIWTANNAWESEN